MLENKIRWLSNIHFISNVSYQSVLFLIVFCIWIIFLTFYMSRVVGPIAALILTHLIRKYGWKCHLKLGSLSISLLSGKIMFRHFTFICDDFGIYCNDGYLIFSYWRHIKLMDIYALDLKGRLHLTLNGLRIHIYNRLEAYRKLEKDPKFEKLFATLPPQPKHNDGTLLSNKEKNNKLLENFWSFIGTIRITSKNVYVYVGNRLLPATLVIFSHKMLFTVRLHQVNNAKLLVCSINGSDFSISLNNNEEYDETDPWNLWKRYDAPRTMGSGFKVLQNATVKATYRSSIFVDSSSSKPICDLNVDFGENVAIAYGPWAEACRVAFLSYFFPANFTKFIPSKLPESGEREIPLVMDIKLTMSGRTTINLWFVRRGELNTIVIIIKNGLLIQMENPLVTDEKEGYKTTIQFSMRDVQFLLTSGFRKLISYEDMHIKFNMCIPKQYGQLQKCEISMKMDRVTTWCILDHFAFILDFVSECLAYRVADLVQFVPIVWDFWIEFTNAKFIFVTNDKNWVDASDPSNNFLIALVAKRFTVSCNLNMTDFCPQKCHCKPEIVASEAVTVKFHIPARCTLSPVMDTLYDNSFYSTKHSSIRVPTTFDLDARWLDFLRTRKITCTCDYTWHPHYPLYESDLPARAKTNSMQYSTHPFQLQPDSVQIDIVIQSPEIFISGFALWIFKNFANDYCGPYSQQQSNMDSYHAHAVLSRKVSGHVKHEIEKYRPLHIKLSVRTQDVLGHCLIHATKTTGESPDTCPTMKVDIIVIEVVREIRDYQFQVFMAGLQISFSKSDSFKKVQDGQLSINRIAVRMETFSSELHIPWDAGVVEYASACEIIVGEITARIDPTQSSSGELKLLLLQLVRLLQMFESFLLLAAAIDEELLVPEIYEVCQHKNNLRTCPHSNLKFDLDGRDRNCECSENLKYILFRAGIDSINILIMEDTTMICLSIEPCRMCTCNCHESSFCTSFLFGILQFDLKQYIKCSINEENDVDDHEWLECGSAHFQDIEFEIRLPFSSENLYLINERKKFLMLHDEYTKRLYFLWLNDAKCGCYGCFAFFGEDDCSGCIFMADFMQKLARLQINNEPRQPGFGQSIIRPSTKLLEENSFGSSGSNILPSEYKQSSKSINLETSHTHPEKLESSSSGIPFDTYHSFLNVHRIQFENFPGMSMVKRFKLIRNGINDLHLIDTRIGNESKEGILSKKELLKHEQNERNIEMIFCDQRPSDWGTNPKVIYGWGNISSVVKIFVTPLSVKVIQRLTERAEMMLTAINPISIIQHAYASCALKCHKQPIIEKNDPFVQNSLLPEVSANFGLPPLYLTFFQGTAVNEQLLKGIKSSQNQSTMTETEKHCTVIMIYGQECSLHVSSIIQNNLQVIKFNAQTLCHAQFTKIVYARESNFPMHNWETDFSTNWRKLNISRRLRHSNLIILSDLNVPNISLKILVNRQNLLHWINGSEVIIRTGEPQLRISDDKCSDKQSDVTMLQLGVTSFIISWLKALREFQKSIYQTLAKYDEWLDLCFCKALSEALDLRDNLILTVCQSSMNEVKRHATAINACASCKLMLFLLHCSVNKDQKERYNYWKNQSAAFKFLKLSRSNRKFVFVALLKIWQELLAPHVKVKKHSGSLLPENIKSKRRPFRAVTEDGIPAKRTTESAMLFPISGPKINSATGGTAQGIMMKQLNILPLVFFWPLFKNYHLDTNMMFKLFCKRLHFSLKFIVGEFKTCLVQWVRDENQSPQQRLFLFLLLDTITVGTTITYDITNDNQQLNVTEASLTINFETLLPRIEIFCTSRVLHLINESLQIMAYCITDLSMIHVDETQNSINKVNEANLTDDAGATQQKWILTLSSLLQRNDINMNLTKEKKSDIGDFSITVNNNFTIPAIKFESKIMHLILILRILNSKISHNNVYFVDKPEKAIQQVLFGIQDIKMVITEKGISDINAIFRGSLTTVTITSRRVYEAKNLLNIVSLAVENIKLNYIIGSSFLIKTSDKSDHSIVDSEEKKVTYTASSQEEHQQTGEVIQQTTQYNFDIKLTHGEMNAKLSSSVAAKYDFKNAHCFGIFPIRATVSIEDHFITYTSFYSKKVPKWMRLGSFSIKLPSLLITYVKYTMNDTEIIQIDDKEIVCASESYANIVITIGSWDQSINTDVLNMLLFSNETALAEVKHIMTIIRTSTAFNQNSCQQFFFQLQIYCENVSPWLKLTLTDRTNTAFRFTAEVTTMFFVHRNILNNEIFERQIRGNVIFCLNFKLGQMIRNEAFQEEEVRELADITTNLKCKLQFGPKNVPNLTFIFSRTVILFKFPAIARAKDILQDFNVSRSFWMKQKILYETNGEKNSSQITSHSSILDSSILSDIADSLVMNITLLFCDRTTICIPLYSSNFSSFTSALLFGLKDAEAIVKLVQGARIKAKFSDFKIVFVENFENSIEESWIDGQEVTPTNFAFFPLGVCKIFLKSSKTKQHRRKASVRCAMKGLLFDIDSRIGGLIGALMNTYAAINEDRDVDVSEYEPMKVAISELEQDTDLNLKNEYASIVKPEKRIRWVEQKIYEQTKKLALTKSHTTDVAYYWELRCLKKFQLMRVKQFKESMLDRLKQQKLRGQQLRKLSVTESKVGDQSFAEDEWNTESVTGEESQEFQEIISNDELKRNTGGKSLRENDVETTISKNMIKADEKLSGGLFIFDMQFFGEAGACMLRNRTLTELSTATVPVNIKMNDETNAGCTKISLPSIEAKIYYSTGDVNEFPKSFSKKKLTSEATSNATFIPHFYVSAKLANMPEETALSPLVAEFFQQLLENLPQQFSQQQSRNEHETFSMTDPESLLSHINSKLMINILLSITIQSSSLRFEAHQQRTGAMDLLLRLPSLKLVASAHNDTINNGFDISLSLRSFSVCFYNPHQPSPLNALALTLDKFIVGVSSTNTFSQNNSDQKITCTIDIGQATFTYDMRKLSQLIAFPGPWYRRKIAQQFLLTHDQFSKTQSPGTNQSFSTRTSKMIAKLMLEASINVHWESFKAKIQMSSAMGDTDWTFDELSTKIIFCLQPSVERRLNTCLTVSLLGQEARGGAISGSLKLVNVAFNFNWISLCNQPPSLSSQLNLMELKMRIVWMGRVVIVVFFDQPSIVLYDEWKIRNDQDGKVEEATVMLNTILKYSKFQAIITKATFSSIDSIIQKLSVFFKEQMQDNRMFHSLTNGALSSTVGNENKSTTTFFWATVLDLVTDMQMESKTFPMPNTSSGRTVISGRFISAGQQASLVLMEGEITANRWALFYLNEPTLVFSNIAQYMFLDENETIGIDLTEKLLLKLSGLTEKNKFLSSNWTSVICKVERHKNQSCPKYATIQECLTVCIDEPLAQLFSSNHDSKKLQPMVLELFELPAMDSIFTSNQKAPIHSEKLRNVKSKVLCSFICDFHYALGVQTDLTTQISFLPELLRSYLVEQEKEVEKGVEKSFPGKETVKYEVVKTDQRQYICMKWKVDPKIRFIDKVKWDPPVIDEILRTLQIFDHRNTTPKVVQRHILDHCDMFASKALSCIVKVAKKASVKSDSVRGHF